MRGRSEALLMSGRLSGIVAISAQDAQNTVIWLHGAIANGRSGVRRIVNRNQRVCLPGEKQLLRTIGACSQSGPEDPRWCPVRSVGTVDGLNAVLRNESRGLPQFQVSRAAFCVCKRLNADVCTQTRRSTGFVSERLALFAGGSGSAGCVRGASSMPSKRAGRTELAGSGFTLCPIAAVRMGRS